MVNNHGDRKSPKCGCFPSKMAVSWLINGCLLTTYIHWADPPTALPGGWDPSSYRSENRFRCPNGKPMTREMMMKEAHGHGGNRSGQISSRPKTRVFTLNKVV